MSRKVCIVTDSLSSGGAEKMAANMSISLVKAGHEVTVVSMMDSISYAYSGTLYNFGNIKNRNNRLKAFLKLRSFFKKSDFDVVLDHRLRNRFLKELLFSRLVFKNFRVIYCIHHYDLQYYFTVPSIPWLSRAVHVTNKHFVSVSEETSRHVEKELGIKSAVIHNYVMPDRTNTPVENPTNDHDYIVGVGRLEAVKQFDVLIESYKKSRLHKNNIKLLILGEGNQKENLQALIEKLNLKGKVELLGFMDSPSQIIKNAKCLVMSSKYEGFPMVLIEALALKVPLIAFDCRTGPNEIIIDGHNGLLVPDQNIDELTKSMNRLILDTGFHRIIASNIENDEFRFSEEKILPKWINLIESQ